MYLVFVAFVRRQEWARYFLDLEQERVYLAGVYEHEEEANKRVQAIMARSHEEYREYNAWVIPVHQKGGDMGLAVFGHDVKFYRE